MTDGITQGGKTDTTGDLPVPADVIYPWEWREAQRLRALHRRRITQHQPPECDYCVQGWPCTGIQVAEFAEARARGDRPTPPWLAVEHAEDWHARRAVGRAVVAPGHEPDDS